MSKPIRLFFADDHQMFIDGIKALLSDIDGIIVAGEANTGKEVIQKITGLNVDLLLLDIGMEDLNGIEAASFLSKKFPAIKIIALTMYDDRNRVIKMKNAGVKGYILKNTSKTELLQAIKTVATGGTYYSPRIAEIIKKSKSGEETNPVSILTKREIEIIQLIVKAMTNKEIANRLSISELTVNTHRKNAMQKLEVKNTAGLVKFAMDHQLTDL
jgi:DNA-binding NarL/FixJ family response regulator